VRTAWFLVVGLVTTGCRQLLGIGDPVPEPGDARAGDAPASDTAVDARSADSGDMLDGNPICIAYATQVYGGHHYFVTAAIESWSELVTACSEMDGHLVKIETAGENAFIGENFTASEIWIGLSSSNNHYTWTDGTALGSYNGFAGGVVPPGQNNCVGMDSTQWKSLPCTQGMPGVCECE